MSKSGNRYHVNSGYRTNGQPKVRRYSTLQAAEKAVSAVFQQTGVVLSIVRPDPKRTK